MARQAHMISIITVLMVRLLRIQFHAHMAIHLHIIMMRILALMDIILHILHTVPVVTVIHAITLRQIITIALHQDLVRMVILSMRL